VLLFGSASTSSQGIWLRDESGTLQPWLESSAIETHAAFSPDGRWVAHTSSSTGLDEVYVRPFDREGGAIQVSRQGGREPLWRSDGRELFYLAGDDVVVAAVRQTPAMTIQAPRPLFSASSRAKEETNASTYDVSPDGQWFVFVRPVTQQSPPRRSDVVLNWLDEVRRLVPKE
jgi:Tol biopolymer transport system component